MMPHFSVMFKSQGHVKSEGYMRKMLLFSATDASTDSKLKVKLGNQVTELCIKSKPELKTVNK